MCCSAGRARERRTLFTRVKSRKRLLDDGDAGRGGALAHRRIGMSGDKDGRCCEITGAQGRNEIEPAHARHVLVDDVAVAGRERRFREELRAAGEYANREPLDDEGEFQRVANRFVVIDDNDEISALA